MKTYDMLGLMKFTIYEGRIGKRLDTFLAPFLTKTEVNDCIKLYICSPSKFPAKAENTFSGFYKGIYWRLSFDRDYEGSIKKIFFFSAGFNSFLMLRIVIIPFLKHILIQKGGFYVLGSSFVSNDKTYFLFGMPGSGKSSISLNALEKKAKLIADGALIVSPDGTISSLLDEMELRYGTVRRTSFWKILKIEEKFKLQLFYLISRISFYKISFNISIAPSRFGRFKSMDKSYYRHIAISITPNGKFAPVPAKEFSDRIIDWNTWYNSLYGNYFCLDAKKENEQIQRNINLFLSNCSLWDAPLNCAFDEIISLCK